MRDLSLGILEKSLETLEDFPINQECTQEQKFAVVTLVSLTPALIAFVRTVRNFAELITVDRN